MRAGLILILLIFCIMRGNAQEVFSFTFRETPVEEVLKKIEQQAGYIFSYSPSILQPLAQKTISIKQANLEQVLNLLFKSSNISWEKLGRYIILFSFVSRREITAPLFISEPVAGKVNTVARGTV